MQSSLNQKEQLLDRVHKNTESGMGPLLSNSIVYSRRHLQKRQSRNDLQMSDESDNIKTGKRISELIGKILLVICNYTF